jgi:arylsulfate sulfotransferase
MKAQLLALGTLLFSLTVVLGCGGGGSMTQDAADFSLQAAPSTIAIVPGGTPQTLSITASGSNGFKGTIAVTLGSLPAGVAASPASLSLTPGTLGQFSISASPSAAPGTATITITATSGTLTHNATASLTVGSPVTTVSLNTTSFDFGDNLVNNTLTQTAVVVTNTGPNTLTMNPTLTGDPSYSINSSGTCGQQLAAGANCDVILNYTPTTPSAPATQDATLNLGFGDVPDGTPQTVAITGTSAALSAGVVTATDNPQVALYTMDLPFPGSMAVNFGTDTSYGLKTWSQPTTTTTGGPVSIFVAGMLASTTYHMQATVVLANGITVTDTDHTFTTGAVPANMQITVQTTTTSGMTPQPGLEMLNPLAGHPTGVIVTDLSGNILWTYADPGNTALNFIDGVKMLPDGDILMAIGPNSDNPLTAPAPAGTINEIREVNLAGDTVREISIDDLNSELANASCAECNVTLQTFHHDVTPLPNGHWLVLANTLMALSPTSTPPLTNNGTGTTTVLGDVIVDLDQNLQPVWAWNEFNHLDPNRQPMGFPDWTHTNAIVYSPDDGNILVSIRHQNWVVKVNYANGTGDGSILWRLGYQGDFTLVNGVSPTDWQYAQHGPSFFSSNTSGVFSLGLMDNGNDRKFASGVNCGTSGAPPCLYSTIPVWQIDETAKTATLTFHQILPANLFNSFGGNAEQLANGDVEYDLCGTTNASYVYEVTQDSSPQTVWSMHSTGTNLYRASRIPSLYPGVQW